MDANKTAGEETRWQLHKNAACNPEQVLAATPHKTPTVRPPAPITKTIQVRRTRHAGHCWRSRDELIRDVLLWIPTHGRAKAGRPPRTYIQQLCEDTGCCPEDLPRAMNDREECERGSGISVLPARYDDDDDESENIQRKNWQAIRRRDGFIEKQSRHYRVSVLMNLHQDCEGTILVMLNRQ